MQQFIIYTFLFLAATVAGAKGDDTITLTNGCVTISMHQSIHADAVKAGLYDYMAAQCGAMS